MVYPYNYFPKGKKFLVKFLNQSLCPSNPLKQVSRKIDPNFAAKSSVYNFFFLYPSQYLVSPCNPCQANKQIMLLLNFHFSNISEIVIVKKCSFMGMRLSSFPNCLLKLCVYYGILIVIIFRANIIYYC